MQVATLRYDFNGDIELSQILCYFKKDMFSKVIIAREGDNQNEKQTKTHVHLRVEFNCTWRHFNRTRTEAIGSFTSGTRKGTHHLCKKGIFSCSNSAHELSYLGKGNCQEFGSYVYILKEGNVIYSKGYTNTQLDSWIDIGSSIRRASKQPLHKKIISFGDLKELASPEDIYGAVDKYYQQFRDVPVPMVDFDIHIRKLYQKIICALHPKVRARNRLKSMQYMQDLLSI